MSFRPHTIPPPGCGQRAESPRHNLLRRHRRVEGSAPAVDEAKWSEKSEEGSGTGGGFGERVRRVEGTGASRWLLWSEFCASSRARGPAHPRRSGPRALEKPSRCGATYAHMSPDTVLARLCALVLPCPRHRARVRRLEARPVQAGERGQASALGRVLVESRATPPITLPTDAQGERGPRS